MPNFLPEFCSSVVLKFYLQLRQSLVLGGLENFDACFNSKDDNEDSGYDSGDAEFGAPDFDMPESTFMNEDVPISPKMVGINNNWLLYMSCLGLDPVRFCLIIHTFIFMQHDDHFHTDETYGHDNPTPEASLEDLCRSHLVWTMFFNLASYLY